MMGEARQTVERLQLGSVLVRLRFRARKSQQEAAVVMGRTAGRLSQVENGRGGLGHEELEKLLDFYGIESEERETVLALGKASRKREPRRGYVDTLPEPFQRMTDLQATALTIDWYECGIVPGLVQAPDYVRAVISNSDSVNWASSEREIADRIEFRLTQQRQILEATPAKEINVVFTEDTLYHVVGSAQVLRGQIQHLIELSDKYPNLRIRVVLNTVPNNPALGGGLMVLGFGTAPAITFATVLHGPYTYYDQAADTDPMLRIFRRVRELALSPEDTRDLLTTFLREGK